MIPTVHKLSTAKPRTPRTPESRHAGRAVANPSPFLVAGFSLVEVMVAMVIGLLGILVMTQVFSLFEGQRRTTSGGSDAITGGAIALNGVQRDIQQSGWGISALQVIGCTVTGQWGTNVALTPTGPTIALPLVPVTINSALIPAGDPNTDTLLLVSGNSNGTVEGDIIKSVVVGPPAGFVVTSPTVFNAGDRLVAITQSPQPVPCNQTLGVVGGASTSTTVITTDTTAVASTVQGPRLFNLGTRPKVQAYAVRNGKLTVCDYTTNDCGAACTAADGPAGTVVGGSCNASWLQIASDIVSLRAQYGRDTTDGNPLDPTISMDGVADVWDRTVATSLTPVSAIAAANTNTCGLVRVSAIRLALVARSTQPEKAPGGVSVTAAAPLPALPWALDWAGSNPAAVAVNAANAAAVRINLTQTRPDTTTWPTWADFRYKVFETTVPIRNITSLGVVDGC
ncbi:MAG: PilW family protein [Sulfuritalea sp.]|nr:PilW family protein [Sulfuritalea sp.]